MRKWNSERGMSLVEATIILMVLAILTAVIAPSASDYVSDARMVKAKEDVEGIGLGISRLLRDTGSACLRLGGTTGCTKANRVDLLISGAGNNPKAAAGGTDDGGLTGLATDASGDWLPSAFAASAAQRDTIEDQLIENDNATPYTPVVFTGSSLASRGWRGAYLADSGPDPWGFIYQVNAVYLARATDATAGTGQGQASGGWHRDVFAISAGPDGIVSTPFNSNGQNPTGDDVIYVIKGATR
jgi:type II secretory pathway pseudopilin PulG